MVRNVGKEPIFANAPVVDDLGLRLLILCRLAGTNYSEIERLRGLARSSLSAYAGGRLYPYPKLKREVSEHLAGRLDTDARTVHDYLFPHEAGAER